MCSIWNMLSTEEVRSFGHRLFVSFSTLAVYFTCCFICCSLWTFFYSAILLHSSFGFRVLCRIVAVNFLVYCIVLLFVLLITLSLYIWFYLFLVLEALVPILMFVCWVKLYTNHSLFGWVGCLLLFFGIKFPPLLRIHATGCIFSERFWVIYSPEIILFVLRYFDKD